MDQLRKPFLILAVIAVALALLVCLGSNLLTGPPPFANRVNSALANPDVRQQLEKRDINLDDARDEINNTKGEDPPGLAIPYLALINGLLLLVLVITALPLLLGDRITSTVQGIVSIIVGFLGLIGGIVMAIVAFTALILMVSLFLAIPFGTLAYLAIFGSFDTGGAAALELMLMILDIGAFILVIFAQQRFLKSKGLVLLFATVILLTFVTSLLHSIVPGILASITDAIAALINAILGAIWCLVLLIGGIVGALRLLQLGKAGATAQLSRPTR